MIENLISNLNNSIVDVFHKHVSIITDICESPIERLFFLRIVDHVIKQPDRYTLNFIFEVGDTEIINGKEVVTAENNCQLPDNFGRLSGIRVFELWDEKVYLDIFPQYKIEYNASIYEIVKYRLDFGILKYSTKNKKLINKYCIECDGIDFHGKEEQIIKDNKRMTDILIRHNFITMRFLGTQIYNMNEADIRSLLFNLSIKNKN